MKLCTVCGVVTSRAGSRCAAHARQSSPSRHSAVCRTRDWQRLSARVLRAWRGERGDWCPGFRRPAHRASDLTVDHVVPLALGGAPFDIGNTAVLCRSCNSSNGASMGRGRGSPSGGGGLADCRPALSPRQEQVLLLLGDGLGLGEIAGRLGLSEWTVKTHRDEGRRRLNARTSTQAAVLVREQRAATR